jgi:K+-sensing histidine kinase KdpD
MNRYRTTAQGKFYQQDSFILQKTAESKLWLIRIRWWIPPFIVTCTLIIHLAGVEFARLKLLFIAAFIFGYNIFFYLWGQRFGKATFPKIMDPHRFVYCQSLMDCSSLFLLAYLTGGTASPLVFFFILQIILVATLLPSRSAYEFSTLILIGLSILAVAEHYHWLWPQSISFRQQLVIPFLNSGQILPYLGFLGVALFSATFLTTYGMKKFQNQIKKLSEYNKSILVFNQKLWHLLSMIQTIGSAQHLEQVLDVVSLESAMVMEVKGISVKLLSEDGKFLRYASAYGLPEVFVKEKLIEVKKSPLNQRIIEGEPYVTGNVTEKDMFQFGEVLAEAQVKSVLFLPLVLEEKVIGILGAYCVIPDRFTEEDVNFFRLVAELVAIALENARAYEAVEKLVQEKAWFMMRVTHNLRAPLVGMLGILEVVGGGYLGELNDNQREYLRRLDRRARTMLSMINELMTLAKSRLLPKR